MIDTNFPEAYSAEYTELQQAILQDKIDELEEKIKHNLRNWKLCEEYMRISAAEKYFQKAETLINKKTKLINQLNKIKSSTV